jgi:transposase
LKLRWFPVSRSTLEVGGGTGLSGPLMRSRAPGQNESAGRVKSTQTRPGDHYLKAALGIAALYVSRSKTTYLAVKYRRIQSHAGALRAVVALQHTLLVIVWNMLHDGIAYDELGIDHYDKTNPERARKRLQRRMMSLGFEPNLIPLSAG